MSFRSGAALCVSLAACSAPVAEIDQLNELGRHNIGGRSFHYRLANDCLLTVELRMEGRRVAEDRVALNGLRPRLVSYQGSRGFGVRVEAGLASDVHALMDAASEAQARLALSLVQTLAARCSDRP